MAYYDISLLARDFDFSQRVIACYATEHGPENPDMWWGQHSWEMASAPGFGDKYAYAIANGNPAPGRDPAVIPDEDILAAVQYLMNPPAQET